MHTVQVIRNNAETIQEKLLASTIYLGNKLKHVPDSVDSAKMEKYLNHEKLDS